MAQPILHLVLPPLLSLLLLSAQPLASYAWSFHHHHHHHTAVPPSFRCTATSSLAMTPQQPDQGHDDLQKPLAGSSSSASSSSSPPFRAIIFDIDGTLADSWQLGYDATQVVLKNNNIPLIDPATYHACTRYATPERMARHAGLDPTSSSSLPSSSSAAAADFERTGQRLGAEFDELYIDMVSTTTAGFYDGIHNLLDQIPVSSASNDDDDDNTNNNDDVDGVKLGALTNACVAYAHAVLRVNSKDEKTDPSSSSSLSSSTPVSLSTRFQSVHGADTVPKAKPAPDGLWLVCQELGVDPSSFSSCVYVGDSPTDAMAAKAAGMTAVGVTWGSHSRQKLDEAPFDHICDSVEELTETLLVGLPQQRQPMSTVVATKKGT